MATRSPCCAAVRRPTATTGSCRRGGAPAAGTILRARVRLRPPGRRLRSAGRGVQRHAVPGAAVASRSHAVPGQPCPHRSVEDALPAAPAARLGRRLEHWALAGAQPRQPAWSPSPPPRPPRCASIGVERDRIRVVHNGVEEPGPRCPRPGAAVPRRGAAGRVQAHRSAAAAVGAGAAGHRRAARHRRGRAGAGAAGAMAGPGVEFTGHVSEAEKHRLLCAAWLLLHPSAVEGWGLVVTEAAARGTPTRRLRRARAARLRRGRGDRGAGRASRRSPRRGVRWRSARSGARRWAGRRGCARRGSGGARPYGASGRWPRRRTCRRRHGSPPLRRRLAVVAQTRRRAPMQATPRSVAPSPSSAPSCGSRTDPEHCYWLLARDAVDQVEALRRSPARAGRRRHRRRQRLLHRGVPAARRPGLSLRAGHRRAELPGKPARRGGRRRRVSAAARATAWRTSRSPPTCWSTWPIRRPSSASWRG